MTEFLVWIAASAAVVSAVMGFVLKAQQARNHERTEKRLTALEEHTNGKMDALLMVTGSSERAKGRIEGRREQEES